MMVLGFERAKRLLNLWTEGDLIEKEWVVQKVLGGPGESGMGIVFVLTIF
jgi:hypothetical protein